MDKSPQKSFILHLDSLQILDEMTDEQAGQLFKAIKDYHSGKELETSQLIRIAFNSFKQQFAREAIKYQKVCERNRANGAKGGRPPNQPKESQNNPLGFSKTQGNPKNLDSDNDSDNDNKKISIDTFQPNETSIKRIKEKYPELKDYQVLVDDFIDQAKNRAKPLKDYQAGFRRYLKEGWIKPNSANSPPDTYQAIGDAVRAKQSKRRIKPPTTMAELTLLNGG